MQVPHAPAGLAPPIVSLEDLPMQCHVGLVVQLNPRVFWWDCFHESAAQSHTKTVVFEGWEGTRSSEKSSPTEPPDSLCPNVRQR